MSQIYTIDETQISNVKKRYFIRLGKTLVFVFALVFIPQFVIKSQPFILETYAFSFVFLSAMMFFTGNIASNKLIKSYKSMQLILNDNGVEQKAEMMIYK